MPSLLTTFSILISLTSSVRFRSVSNFSDLSSPSRTALSSSTPFWAILSSLKLLLGWKWSEKSSFSKTLHRNGCLLLLNLARALSFRLLSKADRSSIPRPPDLIGVFTISRLIRSGALFARKCLFHINLYSSVFISFKFPLLRVKDCRR